MTHKDVAVEKIITIISRYIIIDDDHTIGTIKVAVVRIQNWTVEK